MRGDNISIMKNIKIIIAAHKPYRMPENNDLYLPVQVGAAGKESIGFTRDDSGDNISQKNPNFCELTGLYWAWKNLDADYIGLVHYRRYFARSAGFHLSQDEKFQRILTREQLVPLLEKTDIILPRKRKYYIETIYDHYRHTMYIEPLDMAGQIIAEKYPEYSAEFENLKVRRSAHMFNMMIMRKDFLDSYCRWLFDILFELENRIGDQTQYSSFHQRFYGRVSERLLDVYINTNHLAYEELPVIDMESINWFKKGTSYLNAKFFGKKYEKSF